MAGSDDGKITVVLHRGDREVKVEMEPGDRIMDILDRIEVPLDGVLVFRDGVPVPVDEEAIGIHRIRVIRVASGG